MGQSQTKQYQKQQLNTYNSNPQFEDISNQNYADDEKIIELKQSGKQQTIVDYDLAQNLEFTLESMKRAITINNRESQTIPAVVSIKTKDNNVNGGIEGRKGIDLIFIIDKSGSMIANKKMEYLKQALTFMIDMLNEQDRICLIQFDSSANRLCPFTCVSKKNKKKLLKIADNLQASGGNNLKQAVEMAIQAFKKRQFKNEISSIFVLADGQDPFPQILNQPEGQLGDGYDYSLYSFGFGSDHDPKLMTEIAKAKGGSFYYVEKVDMADEFFIDALAGLFSVVGQNLRITVKSQNTGAFSDVVISKVYGEMWKYNEKENCYYIIINQIYSGITKEFVLELSLPPIDQQLKDEERNPILLTGQLEVVSLQNSQTVVKDTGLEMNVYQQSEAIPDDLKMVNKGVETNYMRVLGAEAIKQSMQQAEQNNFQAAQKVIDEIDQKVENFSEECQVQNQMLKNDLIQARNNCQNSSNYHAFGKQRMMQNEHAHIYQQSQLCENEEELQFNNYANKKQKAMVSDRRKMKNA